MFHATSHSIEHELGHTRFSDNISYDPANFYQTVLAPAPQARRIDELLVLDTHENEARKALGLPPRFKYFDESGKFIGCSKIYGCGLSR